MRLPMVVAILLIAPAAASLIEDTAGVHYQHDILEGDAPDACADVDLDRVLPLDGTENHAMLVQEDDENDVFAINLTEANLNEVVTLQLLGSLGVTLYELGWDVTPVSCEWSVFNASAPVYQPGYTDPVPVAPEAGEGEEAVQARIGDYDCGSNWKVVMNHLDKNPAPASLYFEWVDGTTEDVPLYKASSNSDTSSSAQYYTGTNMHRELAQIIAIVPESYDVQMHVAHGSCNTEPWEPTTIEPGFQTGSYAEFPVVDPGIYVLHVFIDKDAVETTQATAEETASSDPLAPRSVDCHDELCTMAVSEISYSLIGGLSSDAAN